MPHVSSRERERERESVDDGHPMVLRSSTVRREEEEKRNESRLNGVYVRAGVVFSFFLTVMMRAGVDESGRI